MLRNTLINFTLKLGLAVSLIYSALEALVVPNNILKHWPDFLVSNVNDSLLIILTSIICIAFVAWFFSNKGQFTSAISLTSLWVLIALFNITDVPFLIDIAPLFFISSALSLRYYPRIRVVAQTKVTPLANVSIPETEVDTHQSVPPQKNDSPESNESDLATTVVESDIHTEHDQHIFVPKQ